MLYKHVDNCTRKSIDGPYKMFIGCKSLKKVDGVHKKFTESLNFIYRSVPQYGMLGRAICHTQSICGVASDTLLFLHAHLSIYGVLAGTPRLASRAEVSRLKLPPCATHMERGF